MILPLTAAIRIQKTYCRRYTKQSQDIDSTLFNTYGNQEGEGFNYHYSSHGYHPLLCYDGLTDDLLKAELRDGTVYTSNGVVEFMKPLLSEYMDQYPDTNVYLRGDSGFAVPELFDLLEHNGCFYAIRLKANNTLYKETAHLTDELDCLTATNKVDYAVCYGEFYFTAIVDAWKTLLRNPGMVLTLIL